MKNILNIYSVKLLLFKRFRLNLFQVWILIQANGARLFKWLMYCAIILSKSQNVYMAGGPKWHLLCFYTFYFSFQQKSLKIKRWNICTMLFFFKFVHYYICLSTKADSLFLRPLLSGDCWGKKTFNNWLYLRYITFS